MEIRPKGSLDFDCPPPCVRVPAKTKSAEKKERKKIWTISRFVRVILAQGPC